ncbi:hypothetical protein BDP27DRAFT_1321648 [Rhodocollybia butyracea]|uniref:Uncharacterized protein n=1 Tax=Rhodocollybia butyracea TaxID=206335 RepID=A0A9P5PYA8_9AGAR|nr:hypothetical protein BDP27DRAFT_1321648 [Rhodocollybia butyracea]
MPKLHLKRTPEEEAARRLRKREKKDAKRQRRGADDHGSKRRRTDEYGEFDDEEPVPGPSNYKPDLDTIRADMEEQRFREKMSMAFEDDERLDSIEARFNSFTHIPIHWGGSNVKRRIHYEEDELLKMDPMTMDDEEYTEYIRMGMYRKTHAQEITEKERQKAERAAKRAHEKAIRAETERLDKLAAAERRARKQQKDIQRLEQIRSDYNDRWKLLLSAAQPADSLEEPNLGFDDIPWPILHSHRQKLDKKSASTPSGAVLSLDDFTNDAIANFLFTSTDPDAISQSIGIGNSQAQSSASEQRRAGTSNDIDKIKKNRKDKLRETFLRFHPDKFEGRLMARVRPDEKDMVRRALGVVVRVLNDLMGQG